MLGSSKIGDNPVLGYSATVPKGAEMASVDGHGTAGSSWKSWRTKARNRVGGTSSAAGPFTQNRGQGIWIPAGEQRESANLGIGTVREGGGGNRVGGPIF